MCVHWLSFVVDLKSLVHQMSSFPGSSLPPFPRLVSSTHHQLRNQVVEARFSLAARYHLRRRVQRRQLNSIELDVTPMLLATTMTSSRSCGVETRHTRTLTTLQNPPYNMYRVGANAHWARRVVPRSVFSNQECTSHCHITQDTHYSSFRKPESQSHHSQSVT